MNENWYVRLSIKFKYSVIGLSYSFIQAIYFYSASSRPLLLRGAPDHSTDTVSEFHAEAPQATVSEGLAQGPYVAARAGFEPATLRTKGDESTNEPKPLAMYIIGQCDGKLVNYYLNGPICKSLIAF